MINPRFKYLIINVVFLLILFFSGTNAEAQTYKYVYYGYMGVEHFNESTGPGTNFYQANYYIEISKKNESEYEGVIYDETGESVNFFGGEETIDWIGDTPPNYIIIGGHEPNYFETNAGNVNWRGIISDKCIGQNYFKDSDCSELDIVKEYEYVYILESHYEKIKPDVICSYKIDDFQFSFLYKNGNFINFSNNWGIIQDKRRNYWISSAIENTKVTNKTECFNIAICDTNFYLPGRDSDYWDNVPWAYNVDSYALFKDDDEAMDSGYCRETTWIFWNKDSDTNVTDDDDKQTTCDIYDNLLDNIESYYSNCKNCSPPKEENNLKETCSKIMQYQDYANSSCLKKCLNITKDLNEAKKTNTENSACGISQKLALYIANIVKWLKYIIPVLVIVLGILDFIKAISADKDDEMKKAQGRFVKRLIAAALIFLVPFIIEFVLDKMGFGEYVSGCGIIDL